MLKLPALLPLLLASCLHAQITTGSIVGSVADPANLPMPGVTVTLEQTATGARRAVQTNERGDFVFSGIAAGEYRVVIAVEGFKTLERGGINLSSAETLSLGAIALEVGSVSDRITVEAQGAAVQTASAERSGLVTSSQVEQLAIRGRQITSLLQLQPGVVMLSDSESITNNIGVSALGGRNNSNNMSIDGVSINDIGNNNGTSVFIGMDAVAEVKMLVSNYQAEYGRLAGANINLVTKSGTRHFHGSASYFKRHEQFNAANFFNNRLKQPKPRYRYNTWSYNVGGPIYIPGKFNRNRDKLFFFFSQEFWPLKQNLAISQITVPTELERAGDFSQSLDLNSKLIVVNDPTSGQPFAGNRMPASRIDPNGQALLKMFSAPNFLDINISARRYNYVFQGENNTPKRTETARIDYNISSKDVLFGSYTHRYDKQTGYRGLPSSGGTNWSQMAKTFLGDGKIFAIRYQRIFSPTLINELNFGFGKRPQGDTTIADEVDRNRRDKVGFKTGQFHPDNNPLNIVPNATFGGVSNPANLFIEQRFPLKASHDTLSITDTLTKIAGGHQLKAGIYTHHIATDRKLYALFNGAFDFGRNVNNPLDTGYAYSNAALGVFSSYTEASAGAFRHYRVDNIEWFVQDNWKASRRLTLDYGVRFYAIPPIHDTQNQLSGFAPGLYDNAKRVSLIVPAIVGGRKVGLHPGTGQTYPQVFIGAIAPGVGDPFNGMAAVDRTQSYPRSLVEGRGVRVAPRVGFAYDPFGKGKTAVRGGFGVFFNREVLESIMNPFAIQTPIVQNPVVYYNTLPNLLSSSGTLFPENVMGIDRYGSGTPTVMNFSMSVQQQVGFGTVVDVGYVGSLGRRLLWRRNINPVPFGANFDPKNADPTNTRVPLPANFLRPVSGYGNIDMSEWAGSSNYHSMQVQANRRFARGFEFGASWTWSKSMDYTDSDTEGIATQVPIRVWNYGLSGRDRTHIFKLNWLWSAPKAPWRDPVTQLLLNGWQASGITTFQSGAPAGVGLGTTVGFDFTGTANQGARTVVTGNPVLPKSERTFSRFFRTDVFRMPERGTVGTAASSVFRGPGINNWDIALFKNFPIREPVRLQFRAELYNAFNHTQFSGVDTNARFDPATGAQANTRFGELTAARDPRVMQLALRFYF